MMTTKTTTMKAVERNMKHVSNTKDTTGKTSKCERCMQRAMCKFKTSVPRFGTCKEEGVFCIYIYKYNVKGDYKRSK